MLGPSSMPIWCIIASEFCERFAFCGLRTILSLYLRNVLCLHENTSTVVYHVFIMVCYTMPLVGALLADNYIGRYRTILYFSIIYLCGSLLTCCSAIPPLMLPPTISSLVGLSLIAAGSGGVKPCVAAFGGDQFVLPEQNTELQKFFSIFYCTVNFGGFMGMIITPILRKNFFCFGDDTCYALGFGFPTIIVALSIALFVFGKKYYKIMKPVNNDNMKFACVIWYALRQRCRARGRADGSNFEHWLDYAEDKYGKTLISEMKTIFSILYLFLPVPFFWSLFDQQGSRWTFQASRLRGEIGNISLMPDQLQVMNPAMVLMMMPICPGGCKPIVPNCHPLQKMFFGGLLASMAFVAAGILQLAIERSTLQTPGKGETGITLLNTLNCETEVFVQGQGFMKIGKYGTATLSPLPLDIIDIRITCPGTCSGRVIKTPMVSESFQPIEKAFLPIIIGQTSDDVLTLYIMDPNIFSKSLTGKPKLKVVYVGNTGPDKNVSIVVETPQKIRDIYYVSNSLLDHIGESAFMCLSPGRFTWRVQSATGSLDGSGDGQVGVGGVYVLCFRERMERLDSAVLYAPIPPNELHVLWIVPQYLLISMAEIMFAVSGLEFSFIQAPKSMKTITIAAWYVSVAFGNLIVILIAQAKVFESRAMEFFAYATMLMCAMFIFMCLARGYQKRHGFKENLSLESQPLLKISPKAISLRSLQGRSRVLDPPYKPYRSSFSYLAMLEDQRARTQQHRKKTIIQLGSGSSEASSRCDVIRIDGHGPPQPPLPHSSTTNLT